MRPIRGWLRPVVAVCAVVAALGACSSDSKSTATTVTVATSDASGFGLSQTMSQGVVAVRVPANWSTGAAPPPDNLVSSLATSGPDSVKITIVHGPFDAISAGIVGDQSAPNVNQVAISGHQAVRMDDTSGAQVIDETIVDVGPTGTALILVSGPNADRALLEAIVASATVS